MEATSALKPQRDLTTKIKAVIFDCGGVLAGALIPVAPVDLKRLPSPLIIVVSTHRKCAQPHAQDTGPALPRRAKGHHSVRSSCFLLTFIISFSLLLLTSRRYCHKGPDRAPGPCYRYWNNIKSMPEYKEADYWQDFKTMGTPQSRGVSALKSFGMSSHMHAHDTHHRTHAHARTQ